MGYISTKSFNQLPCRCSLRCYHPQSRTSFQQGFGWAGWKRTIFNAKNYSHWGTLMTVRISMLTAYLQQRRCYLLLAGVLILSPSLIMLITVQHGLTNNFGWMDFFKEAKHATTKSILSLFTPKLLSTELARYLATVERPRFLANYLKITFMKTTGITLDDAIFSNVNDYKNVQALFTRKLKSNARTIDYDCDVISPCDGTVINAGVIDIENTQPNQITLEYIKGQNVNLELLLGEHETRQLKLSSPDNHLYYAILYLAPNNYHCFHSPAEWKIDSIERIKGGLYPVSPDYLKMLPGEACANERVLIKGEWKNGLMYVIPIGAMNVGGIVITAVKELRNVASRYWHSSKITDVDMEMKRAMPLGEFLLGSTIVLLYEAPKSKKLNIPPQSTVLVGQSIM